MGLSNRHLEATARYLSRTGSWSAGDIARGFNKPTAFVERALADSVDEKSDEAFIKFPLIMRVNNQRTSKTGHFKPMPTGLSSLGERDTANKLRDDVQCSSSGTAEPQSRSAEAPVGDELAQFLQKCGLAHLDIDLRGIGVNYERLEWLAGKSEKYQNDVVEKMRAEIGRMTEFDAVVLKAETLSPQTLTAAGPQRELWKAYDLDVPTFSPETGSDLLKLRTSMTQKLRKDNPRAHSLVAKSFPQLEWTHWPNRGCEELGRLQVMTVAHRAKLDAELYNHEPEQPLHLRQVSRLLVVTILGFASPWQAAEYGCRTDPPQRSKLCQTQATANVSVVVDEAIYKLKKNWSPLILLHLEAEAANFVPIPSLSSRTRSCSPSLSKRSAPSRVPRTSCNERTRRSSSRRTIRTNAGTVTRPYNAHIRKMCRQRATVRAWHTYSPKTSTSQARATSALTRPDRQGRTWPSTSTAVPLSCIAKSGNSPILKAPQASRTTTANAFAVDRLALQNRVGWETQVVAFGVNQASLFIDSSSRALLRPTD
uniref:Uncharacterized protein n=1 Tax=Mycena chlorophos TaxID=658473 RepID=A0ABQ0KXK0_MYCCL|nr:predicted protein [Mycena chlorophos]